MVQNPPSSLNFLKSKGEFPVLKELTVRLERSSAKRTQVIDFLHNHHLTFFSK